MSDLATRDPIKMARQIIKLSIPIPLMPCSHVSTTRFQNSFIILAPHQVHCCFLFSLT